GTVARAVRPSIVERGPLTCTVGGSTATRGIAGSGSGVPRIWGTTRSVLATAPASLTWRRAGVTRLTTTPGGVCTRSGERATTFSPSRIPLRLARTRTAPRGRRATAQRAASSSTSTVSRGRPTSTRSPSRPVYSTTAATASWLLPPDTTTSETAAALTPGRHYCAN